MFCEWILVFLAFIPAYEDCGEAGLLNELVAAGVVRPLGVCDCNTFLRASTKASQSKKKDKGPPIACAFCPRCQKSSATDYEGTPLACERNRLGLVKTMCLIVDWLEGISNTKAASTHKVCSKTVSELRRKLRHPIVWDQMNLPLVENEEAIVDITFGPRRRSIRYGPPSRPRPLEAVMFQVALAYAEEDGRK